MAGYGLPEAGIARVLATDPETLRLHYAAELETGQLKANAKVAENLYRKATGDGREAVTAAIFWLKTRAKWKETTVNEVIHDATDPIARLLQRIGEQGRAIHDRGETASAPALAASLVGTDDARFGSAASAQPVEARR